MSKNSICIVGQGAWGKAMFHVLRQNSAQVRMIGRGEVVTEDIVVIAVPTNNIHELKSSLQPKSERPVFINTSKGVEEKSHRLPHEIIRGFFPLCRYYTLIGPGFAGEVMRDMPTLVNLGYGQEKDEAEEIIALFQTDTFRVRQAEAIHILELSAAMKNIYAIGCGLADGLGYEINTRTLLTVIAIEELQRLFSGLGLQIGIRSTAGTIGDLMLTCNSQESRNFSFGRAIATGSVAEALERAKGVVEGYPSLNAIAHWEKRSGSTLPLAQFIRDSVEKNKPQTLKERFSAFIRQV